MQGACSASGYSSGGPLIGLLSHPINDGNESDDIIDRQQHVWPQCTPSHDSNNDILVATRGYHGTREYHVSPASRRLLDHSGQQNEGGASMPSHMPHVIMTIVSYFCGLPGLARKARKHYHDTARVAYQSDNLPKQSDATLCWCRQVRRQRTRWHVYITVVNVLGTC